MQTNKIGRPPPIEAFGAVIKAYYKRRELRYEVCVELNKLWTNIQGCVRHEEEIYYRVLLILVIEDIYEAYGHCHVVAS